MADLSKAPPDAPEPWPPPAPAGSDGALAVVSAGLVFALFLFVGTPIQLLLNLGFGLWFTEIFVILGVPWVLLRVTGRDPRGSPGLAWPGGRTAALGFLIGTVNFVALAGPIQAIAQALAPARLRQEFDQSQIFENQTRVELVVLVAAVSIAAPICEEYFFRGVLQRGLMTRLRPATAIALAGFIFSAFHVDPIGLAGRWELGILFGCLFYWTGSLWPGVMAHAANNLVSTALYFLAPEADPTAADQPPPARAIALMFLIGSPILFALLRAVPRSAPPPPAREFAPPARPPPFFEAARPWFLAAVASLGLLAAVDYRGVTLNFYDLQVRLPEEKDASPRELAEREGLETLRKAARSGKVPISEYVARRRALARRLGGPEKPAVPAPPQVPSPPAPHSKR